MTQFLVISLIILVIGFILSFSPKEEKKLLCPDCRSYMKFVEYIEEENRDLYRCPVCGKILRVIPE